MVAEDSGIENTRRLRREVPIESFLQLLAPIVKPRQGQQHALVIKPCD